MSIDIYDHPVTIITLTDGYSSCLLLPISISLPYPFLVAQDDEEDWGRAEGFGIPSPQFLTSLT
jgi:hypothetical protein